jgi:hypothetical protein
VRSLLFAIIACIPAAAVAAAAPVPATNAKFTPPPQTCPQPANVYAAKPGDSLKPRKLTELPPANLYSAVYRRDANGCEKPIVVKYGVGRR